MGWGVKIFLTCVGLVLYALCSSVTDNLHRTRSYLEVIAHSYLDTTFSSFFRHKFSRSRIYVQQSVISPRDNNFVVNLLDRHGHRALIYLVRQAYVALGFQASRLRLLRHPLRVTHLDRALLFRLSPMVYTGERS